MKNKFDIGFIVNHTEEAMHANFCSQTEIENWKILKCAFLHSSSLVGWKDTVRLCETSAGKTSIPIDMILSTIVGYYFAPDFNKIIKDDIVRLVSIANLPGAKLGTLAKVIAVNKDMVELSWESKADELLPDGEYVMSRFEKVLF